MSRIRPLRDSDIPGITGLFQSTFRDGATPPPSGLSAYLRSHYLEAPVCDPDIPSLVHAGEVDEVVGFIGVHVLPMSFGERRLRAAIASSIMVDPRAHDAMAGPRLLRAFLGGAQDISFSETANAVAAQMWTGLRGILLPQYSLDWMRVIRPAAFALDLASRRVGAARLLGPLARAVDGRLRGGMQENELRWTGVPEQWKAKGGLTAVETDQAGFGALLEPLLRPFALRPAWSAEQLDHILAEAADKPEYGDAAFVAVHAPTGALVGAFVYHASPGRIGRVLQVLALHGQAGPVLDCLIGHAAARGAAGLRGRTQPALLAAMVGRKTVFTQPAATVVHAQEAELLQAFQTGQGFFNGLAGENWSRLAGGRFD
jgi:hypothetical protein